jgi:hypothetical protein
MSFAIVSGSDGVVAMSRFHADHNVVSSCAKHLRDHHVIYVADLGNNKIRKLEPVYR